MTTRQVCWRCFWAISVGLVAGGCPTEDDVDADGVPNVETIVPTIATHRRRTTTRMAWACVRQLPG